MSSFFVDETENAEKELGARPKTAVIKCAAGFFLIWIYSKIKSSSVIYHEMCFSFKNILHILKYIGRKVVHKYASEGVIRSEIFRVRKPRNISIAQK